jgi:hypothetical protein
MFSAEESWLRLFRMVGIILDTVASNVLSPFHTQTLTDVLAAQAMQQPPSVAALLKAHVLIQFSSL